jgi:hypothetical protein
VYTFERRFSERRPAGENRARITWDGGPDPPGTPARLLDISRGGAGFVSDQPPPTGREVRIRLEAPRETGWVQALVVRSDGASEFGLFFDRYFPYDLFASLV